MEKGFVRKLWKFPIESQRAVLAAQGLSDRDIYQDGKGDENAEALLRSFRGRGGTLYIAADMRVFGDNQAAIAKFVDKCELQGIRIVDLAHPELKTHAAQIKWAYGKLAEWRRWGGDKKRARRIGALGGKKRGENAAAKRAEKLPDAMVSRLLGILKAKRPMTWRVLAWALGISTATLRRHYEPIEPRESDWTE